MPGRRVSIPIPLLTPYFPQYAEEHSDSLAALLSGNISAVFGGSAPYLQVNEEWPKCKTCGHHLIPYIQINVASPKTPQTFREHVPPLSQGGATLFQVFICAVETDDGTCFEGWVHCTTEGESWLVRKVHCASDQSGVVSNPAHEAARDSLENEGLLIPERVILGWEAGNPETEHEAASADENFDEQYYEQHEPAEGLKLLGYPIRGKYYNTPGEGNGFCVQGESGPHVNWRCLIQLGTQDDENPIYTTGNIYVDQCELHPDVYQAVCSGDW